MKTKQWCSIIINLHSFLTKETYGIPNRSRPKNRYIRCPRCNKRLLVQWYDCGDGNCWHPKISAHKEK